MNSSEGGGSFVLRGSGWVGPDDGPPPRPTLARAVVLADDSRLTLPPELLAQAVRRYRAGDDPLDIVLVARDAASALLLRLPPGLALAGVVAEEEGTLASDIAVVAAVTGARDLIAENELVIVDPRRGRVVIAPDAHEIARLQTSENAGRPRVFVGAAHTPARTQSGVLVAVWAHVETGAERDTALENGADGLVVTASSELVSSSRSDDDAPWGAPDVRLQALALAVGGGALAVRGGGLVDALDPLVLVRAAALCDLRWLLDLDTLPLPLDALRAQLSDLVFAEGDADRAARMPRLVALLAAPNHDPTGFDEAMLLTNGAPPASPSLPTRVWLGEEHESDEETLSGLIAAGIVGVVTGPEHVEAVKNLIRGLE